MSLKHYFILAIVGAAVTGLPYNQPYDLKELKSLRIIGGQTASEGDAPYMVALVVNDWFLFFICGGSIISQNHVLTAAHCLDSLIDWDGKLISSFKGVIGSNKYTATDKDNIIKFSGYKIHPTYDAGILFTKEIIKLSYRVQVLPMNFERIDGGVSCIVTGWGRDDNYSFDPSETLQYLFVKTLAPERCSEIMRQTVSWRVPEVNHNAEICTLHSKNHGMCHGDSGSPLVKLSDNHDEYGSGPKRITGVQIGLVSWGYPCARGAPDVFVRMTPLEMFIKEAMSLLCEGKLCKSLNKLV